MHRFMYKKSVIGIAALSVVATVAWQTSATRVVSAAKMTPVFVLAAPRSGEVVDVISAGAVTMAIPLPQGYTGAGTMAVNPAGTVVYVSVSTTDFALEPYGLAILGFDTATGREVADLHGGTDQVAVSPDGARVYADSAESTGGFVAFDTSTNQQVGIVGAGDTVSTLAISQDARRIYAPAQQPDGKPGISVYDTSTGTRVAGVDVPDGFSGGSSMTFDGTSTFLDIEPGTWILDTQNLTFHESPANGVQSAISAATNTYQVTVADGSAIADVDPRSGVERNVVGGSFLPYSRMIAETATAIFLANLGTGGNLVTIVDPRTRTVTSIVPTAGTVLAMEAG